MKKIFLNLLILVLFGFIYNYPVLSATPLRKEIRNTIRETVQEGKEASLSPQQIRQEVREAVREEIMEKKEGIMEKLKGFLQKKLRWAARVKGIVESIGENQLTVRSVDGKVYTVNISDKTKLVRRFGGKSSLNEFSVGDEVNVIGKFTDENQTTIEAVLIRNLSLQKRWGAFLGTVKEKGSDNFVMETINRGSQTVYFSGAKLVNRRQEPIVYNDIQVGHRVRVKGVWDRELNKISPTDEVKDFNLPPLPTKAAE